MLNSLRVRMLLVGAIVLLPLAGLLVFEAAHLRDVQKTHARQIGQVVARQLAQDEQGNLVIAQVTLAMLAQIPAVQDYTSPGCGAYLGELLARTVHLTALAVASPSGDVVCGALATAEPVNIADRVYFQRTLETRSFSVGGYQIGRESGTPSLNFGFPLFDATGTLIGVLIAGLDLSWLAPVENSLDLPEGSTITFIDRDGIVLYRFPDSASWTGKAFPDAELFALMEDGSAGATGAVSGLDGVTRLYSTAPVGDIARPDAYLAVGIPTQTAYAAAERGLIRDLILLCLVSAAAVSAGWFAISRQLERPVRSLQAMAGQMEIGDFTARASFRGGWNELTRLAESFNRMALAIQQRDRDLTVAENRYRTIVETAREGICVIDPDQTVTYVNSSMVNLLGYSSGEMVGRPVASFIDGEADARVAAQVERRKQGFSDRYECTYRRKDGSLVWANVSAAPLIDETGAFAGALGLITDITAHRAAEAARLEAESRFRAAFEQSVTGMALVSPGGRWLLVNQALCEMVGYEPDELLQLGYSDLTHPEDNTQDLTVDQRALAGELSTFHIEKRYIHKNGQTVWVHLHVSLSRDPDGTPLYFVTQIENITARKLYEEAMRQSDERLELALSAARMGIWSWDVQSDLLQWSIEEAELFGLPEPPTGLTGIEAIQRFVHPDDRPLVLGSRCYRAGDRETNTTDYRIVLPDGTVRWIEDHGRAVEYDAGNRPLRVSGVTLDVTARKAAEEQTRLAEARFRALVQFGADVIAVTDAEGIITFTSPSIETVLGYDENALIGLDSFELIHPGDRERASLSLGRASLVANKTVVTELRLLHRDSSWRTLEVLARDALDDPSVCGIVINARDITERKEFESRLAYQAFHDSLTELPNRALFNDRLEHALARAARQGGSVAVLLIDLDDFKVVNDGLGHAAGDQMLVEIAGRLNHCIREGDTVARLGGDEFACILEDLSGPSEAGEIAERILRRLLTPVQLDGHALITTTSIGIAINNIEGATPAELVRYADQALYTAKRAGKNRVAMFNQAMNDAAWTRMALVEEMRQALHSSEFCLYYQPVIDLSTGHLTGIEALIRWQHPRLGIVQPGAFIPLAEETGLIVQLGNWVLAEACGQVRRWTLQNPAMVPLTVSVNLSARQLQQPGLIQFIRDLLLETGLPPEQLMLEITESVAFSDTDKSGGSLRELKELGIRLAVDDFGTGYSGLSSLKSAPIDVLKIDRTFIAGLGIDPEDEAIVRAVLAFAKSLSLGVTAEGVETAEQVGMLRSLGCDSAQGFFFATPQPAEAMSAFISSSHGLLEPDRFARTPAALA